jgi:hypothetical protein
LTTAGNEIAVKELTGLFPGKVEVDFGKISEPGYYAIYPALYTPDDKLIMNYPSDGFSVVVEIPSKSIDLTRKSSGITIIMPWPTATRASCRKTVISPGWSGMGIYKSYGSYPGFDSQYRSKWERAKQLGLVLFADSSGDSSWLNDNPSDGQNFISQAASFTRFFKATNEIDIRHEPEWQKLRDPVHWVERAKWEYEQAHKQRSDAITSAAVWCGRVTRRGAGQWFKQVLELGLDHYQDAWDIHAYPQQAPQFGGPIGNGESEDERGVLAAYASLGRNNTLPFWLGETAPRRCMA